MRFISVSLLVLVLGFCASLPVLFGFSRGSLLSTAVLTASALVCFIAVPLLYTKYVLRTPFAAVGWRFPDKSSGVIRLTLLVLAPHVVVLGALSFIPAFREFYTFPTTAGVSHLAFVIPFSILYYAAEEFLFRGFFFLSLEKISVWGAYAANAVLFALLHLGKPSFEVVFAVVSALLLCWLTKQTRSFIPAAAVHFSIAVFLNVLIYLH